MAQTRLRPLVHPSWEEKVNEKLSPDRGVSDFGESLKEALGDVMGGRYIKPLKSGSGLFVPDPNTSRQKIVLGDKQTLVEIQSKFKEGDEVVVVGKDGKKNNRFTGVFKGVFGGLEESVWVSLGGDPKMFRLGSYEIVPYNDGSGESSPNRKGGVTSLRSRKLGVINPPDYKPKPIFPTLLTELSPTIKLLTSLLKKKEPEPQLEILESVCETCKGFIFYQKSETPSCHRCQQT